MYLIIHYVAGLMPTNGRTVDLAGTTHSVPIHTLNAKLYSIHMGHMGV